MWVDGKEVPGELVEAAKAREIYTSIVQRTLDPGLLEYMGTELLKLRVFPVPPKGDQKIALSYTSIATSENGLVEYVYPLKTEGKAVSTLEKFSLNINLKSQHALQNIYSPTHAITLTRPNDTTAVIGFEKDQAILERDFQLFYTLGTKDVGLTVLTQRPNPSQNGYFMMLVSPRAELSKSQQVPRDMVFVLDTSGSMRGKRMNQGQNALKYCLSQLTSNDRFAVLNFATTVNKYAQQLQPASADNIASARKWVDALEATGGTAINDALAAALDMRTTDETRTFTIVFFTDGRPTIGETNAEKIVKNVEKKNTGNTRVFTFGVGDDVNAALLDQLADNSRAVSTYVREAEDIEAKVSSLYGKISNPVLANLKLSISEGVSLNEVYPPQLPDLFHGSQLVILGRYTGKGHAAVTLTGNVGKESKEFVYELNFPEKSMEDKAFVEDLWARRKVGYLLDQIRVNGEKKELVDEVVTLAKRYGITTPYTSYLVVPDGPLTTPVAAKPAAEGKPDVRFHAPAVPAALAPPPGPASSTATPAQTKATTVNEFLKVFGKDGKGNGDRPAGGYSSGGGGVGDLRDQVEQKLAKKAFDDAKEKGKKVAAKSDPSGRPGDPARQPDVTTAKIIAQVKETEERRKTLDRARLLFDQKKEADVQVDVDFAVQNNNLRFQERLSRSASRNVQSRNVIDVGGVWIDDGFNPKMATVTVKTQSKAYFRILERFPRVRDVFQLGNHVVWVTPSGTALILDQGDGREDLPDADIDRLFTAPAKK
jgi:Ca-activated chloride channel family protein